MSGGEPDDRPVSERVVEAVTAARDVRFDDIEPLYTAVDPESLDRLFESGPGSGDRGVDHVAFSFAGCDVTVSFDGSVDATPREDGAASTDSSHVSSTGSPESGE